MTQRHPVVLGDPAVYVAAGSSIVGAPRAAVAAPAGEGQAGRENRVESCEVARLGGGERVKAAIIPSALLVGCHWRVGHAQDGLHATSLRDRSSASRGKAPTARTKG